MGNRKCSEALLKLKEQLYKEIDEESKADIKYAQMSGILNGAGLGYLSEIVDDIALDERRHHLILKGLVDAITQECGS